MQTNPTNPTDAVQPQTNNRRTFLRSTAAALLAGAALPKAAEASIHHLGGDYQGSNYLIGLVLNPALAGLSGELILNVYLSVTGDGTGPGLLTDPLHPTVNSYLAVQRSAQQGNQFLFEGVVSRSNTPGQVGQAFAVAAEVHAEFTTLELVFNGERFSGQGARAAWIDPETLPAR
jgi:hypothetical protein